LPELIPFFLGGGGKFYLFWAVEMGQVEDETLLLNGGNFGTESHVPNALMSRTLAVTL
jgi:hypothetical protein